MSTGVIMWLTQQFLNTNGASQHRRIKFLIFGFGNFMGFVDNNKNIKYHPGYR